MGLDLPGEAPTLKGERVTLRPPVPSDVEGRQACGTHADIVRAFGGSPGFDGWQPMSHDDAGRWLAEWKLRDTPLKWIIEVDGRFAGETRLHSIRPTDEKARFAIGLLDPSLHGRGLGQEVTRLVVGYGFEGVGLHRIDLKVFADLHRAVACYEACGFRVEGREREAALVDARRRDDLVMGVLRPEWQALHEFRSALLAGRSPVVVDEMTEADLARLGWSGDPLHVESMRRALTRAAAGEVEYLVVRTPSGEPVAKAGIDYALAPGSGTIWQVATHPAYQRVGLAEALLVEAERRIAARGLATARLGVELDNHRARRIYERRGYQQVGTEDESWPTLDADGRQVTYHTTCAIMTRRL